tara:strand:+ start:409 stop:720 length:312 start_codon:yes stop_codon:yes gene_type:complete
MVSDTTHIEANYSASLQFNLSDYDVKIEDIETYWIKWGQLFIIFKDGSEESFEPTSEPEPDYKWPVHIQEWAEDDKEWKESLRPIKVEERIIVEEEEIKEEED